MGTGGGVAYAGIVTVADLAETTVPHFAVTYTPYVAPAASPKRVRGFVVSIDHSTGPVQSARVSQTL